MLLQIKYFGMLTESTNCTEESLEFSGATVYQLLDQLKEKYPDLNSKDFKVAINREIVDESIKIEHPEIALLPPFSGG
jgi:molybdopterin converting factor small subunit